ncbi:MAG: hypothetical protein PHV59_06855 [Victivallales bacterium]|nr:hypothetical protein [Victivallales bacterium]
MNSRKILKLALKGCDRREVARAIGMSLGSLNNQVAGELPYFPKGNTQNFVDRIVNFIDISYETTGRMILLEEIAEEFGFLLISNPMIHATSMPAVAKVSEILRDFAAVVDEIGQATADGRIEFHEAAKIRTRWETMKRITEEFVLACETGAYDARQHSNQNSSGKAGNSGRI